MAACFVLNGWFTQTFPLKNRSERSCDCEEWIPQGEQGDLSPGLIVSLKSHVMLSEPLQFKSASAVSCFEQYDLNILDSVESSHTISTCVDAKLLQLCPALSDLMDYSPSGSSVHGIFQARKLEWVAKHFSREIFPIQGWNPHRLCLLFWQVGSLSLVPSGKPTISPQSWLKYISRLRL